MLGRLVYKLRNKKGLSQEELSLKCNLNIRSIQRIESGKVKPRLSTLKAISSILDHDLLKEKEPLKPSGKYILKRKRNIQKTGSDFFPNVKFSPLFSFIYSSIISLIGLFFLSVVIITTYNNLDNTNIVYFIFFPGLFGSLIILLLGSFVFKYERKKRSETFISRFNQNSLSMKIKKFV